MNKTLVTVVLPCLLFIAAWSANAAPLVLVTTEYPPFSYVEDGQQKGIAVDLVKEASTRLHEEINIVFLPFARAVNMIEAGEADAIFPFSSNDKRSAFTLYPDASLVEQEATLFVRADSAITFDGNLSKLSQYSFGIERGANYGPVFSDAVRDHVVIHVDETVDQLHNVRKLVAGRFEIAVGPRLVVLFYAKQAGQLDHIKELQPGIGKPVIAYLGFSKKKNPGVLVKHYDQIFKKMRQDGTYDKIVRSYSQ